MKNKIKSANYWSHTLEHNLEQRFALKGLPAFCSQWLQLLQSPLEGDGLEGRSTGPPPPTRETLESFLATGPKPRLEKNRVRPVHLTACSLAPPSLPCIDAELLVRAQPR